MTKTTAEPQQGMRRHKLLPADIRKKLPAIGTTDGQGMDAIAQVKFFCPTGRFTMYVTEFDGEDTLYGYTVSALGPDCDEWGYASFSELAEMTHPVFKRMPAIERDCYWDPRKVGEAVGS